MRNSYRPGIHGLLAIALLVGFGTARGAAVNGLELYRDGHLVDALDINPFTETLDGAPQLRGTINAAAAAPAVSPETLLRNSLFRNASEPAARIQEWLYTLHSQGLSLEAGDYEQLELLLRDFRAAQGDMWSAMARIGNQIEQFNLDPVIMERHQQTATAIEDGTREFTAAVSAVLQGGDDALAYAIDVMDRLKFREDPQILQNGFPYAVHKVEAPRMSRAEADQVLRSAPGRVAAEQTTLPPVQDDLAETPDIKFTQAIIDKAAELGNSPLAIYDFVHDQAGFQLYTGSRKGAANTLQQLRGNDTDQVSLLLALLREAGIPSRYVRGTVEITPADAMSWLGVDDGLTAAGLLATAGFNAIAIFSGPDDLVAIRFTHVWAMAYVPYGNYRGVPHDATGKLWVALDPSFKRLTVSPGEDILTAMGFDVDAFIADYLSAFTEPSPIEQLELDIQAYLDAQDPGKTVADIERRTEIAAQLLGVLPGSSQGTVLLIQDEFAALADSQRYKVRFELYDGANVFIDHMLSMPELAGKRLTIDYVGATQADQDTLDSFGGIYETPPNLVNVKPRLKLDNVVIAPGLNGIGMGRTHSFDMQFIAPTGASNVLPLVHNDHIAGNGQAIAFDTYLDLNDPYIGSQGFPPDVLLESVLHATAVDYLSLVDRGQEKVQRLMRMLTTQDVSEAIVKNAIAVTFIGVPVSFVWTGLVVDADRRIIGPFAVDGDESKERPYMVLTGADASIMENRVFENIYDQEAISTIKILELASDGGINLCTIITSIAANCPGLSQPPAIVNAVNAALTLGNVVTIPETQITVALWSGTGYIDMDPASGAAGYIISGGISGDVQVFSGGATVDSWTITLPCEAESVTGMVTTPPSDAPNIGAVFCTNNYPITFIVDLKTICKDPPGGMWTKTVTLTTHFTTAQFGPGDYELNLIFFGSTTIRQFRIGEVRIDSLNPASNLILGNDLTVNYTVDLAPGVGLTSADMHIRNKMDTEIFKKSGIPTSAGPHTTLWEKAKWNMGAHAGAFANPNNSNYKAKIHGIFKGKTCDSNEKPINTKLVIEADVRDVLPVAATATRVSGLEDMLNALKIVMKKEASETIISGPGSIMVTDNSAGSKTLIKKHLKVDDPALNSLPDGAYQVLLRDLRDEIGNFGDMDNNPANGIQPYMFDLEIW